MARRITCIPAIQEVVNEDNPTNIQKKKVAAYCRVSTDEEDQLMSYQNQVATYTAKIMNNSEYEFAGVYADEGISGTNTKRRDQFNRMIKDCKAGKIDLILTKSISRFARNTLDCLQNVRELKEIGVEVYFEKESIQTLDASGEVLLTILSSLAQEESRSISENTTWGVRKRFEQGKVTVNEKKFLGYDKDPNGDLVINKQQAAIVKRIYSEFLNGKGPTRIARELERDKVKGVTGTTKWHATTIAKMLVNEKYKGDALLQKTYTTDFLKKTRIKNDGKVRQYYVEESHPPIIAPEVWNIVQLEMERRKAYIERHHLQKYEAGLDDNPFSGRVICGKCGKAYGRKQWYSKNKHVKIWQCLSGFEKKGVPGCGHVHIYDEKLKEAFVESLNALVENKDTFISKWQSELQGADVLKAYRLR